ncbi:MAG: bifunctional glycosyltransferase/class I SAM-dependent methyltransferase [Bacteroides sp.]|nr:bifunctional glycosyltransferase/class I SAM-dependent methyltransferase [Prevotella sp.]MCM1407798.1 bifunctional glycosyltransferase/class I SAM-dependent methyltransferase [Treponema brennaborense]MCM1468854.1 bifunctional glycosyltransferase/class I SAM-dependent methyltransferase [Bacteroides sp.]
MTILVVQSRLASSRLYRKALLPLCGKPLLAWTLDAMKLVPADRYFLATDDGSAPELFPVARECGWECFAGPQDDVLARFCLLIRHCDEQGFHPDTIIRATGDNPFLFYEAAAALAKQFEAYKSGGVRCDYMTWTGLPHGSGVEIFSADSLLAARKLTEDPYDHEHVGPALYNHPERFAAVMLPSPAQWNYPALRTTVDTAEDYRRAVRLAKTLLQHNSSDSNNSSAAVKPFPAEQIIRAAASPSVAYPVLCVPSVKKGQGTGHLRRCLSVAEEICADIFIDDAVCTLTGVAETAACFRLDSSQIIGRLPAAHSDTAAIYSSVLCDMCRLTKTEAARLSAIAPVIALDEGSSHTDYCDYLLDIIPPKKQKRRANLNYPAFIPLPEHKKQSGAVFSVHPSVLVAVGGEDPANLSIPAANAFAAAGCDVTMISVNPAACSERADAAVTVIEPVGCLREQLYKYDIVVTHYGFTAFEALAAGCAVVLLATSKVHRKLSAAHGFVCLEKKRLAARRVKKLLSRPESLYNPVFAAKFSEQPKSLAEYVLRLSSGKKYRCPICGKIAAAAADKKNAPDAVIARSAEKTYRRCSRCGIVYLSWSMQEEQNYDKNYFFGAYRKQYGKTYLDDFSHIRQLGRDRMREISRIFAGHCARSPLSGKISAHDAKPAVLDVGCAYGPFLAAADEAGWQVFGADVSQDAVSYITETLGYPAVCADFTEADISAAFGRSKFDAVAMWFVIEHFPNLRSVLDSVSNLLPSGGIFAFSTPSASGISARCFPASFFEKSPSDHFTVWSLRAAKKILSENGFIVKKIISTGHHPERFPLVKNHPPKTGGLPARFLGIISRLFRLGDTFEIYCVKR